MVHQTIQIAENNNIGIITLHRPEKKNALSIQMRKELIEALDRFKDDNTILAVIITGSSNCFCAGFDLSEFGNPDLRNEVFSSSKEYHQKLWNFPKPTIAAINGYALAGGLDLAALCDIRICDHTAIFGHPEIKLGAPPLFTPLRWIVGDGNARYICFMGKKFNANDALRFGLVSEVVETEKVLSRAKEIASAITEAPLETLSYVKGYISKNRGNSFSEIFSIEHDEVFEKFLMLK